MINRKILKIAPYQPGRPIEEVQRSLGLKEVIKLASNENPLGPSPKAVSAIRKSLGKLNRYPEGACFLLRQRLAKGLGVKPGNLIFGNGSDEIIDIIIKTFSEPGDEIITADTTFLEYKIISQQNGRRVRFVPLQDFRYNLSAINEAIGPKTKAVFIANPNNPTGTYVSKAEVDAFFKGLPERVVVIFDEAYLEFADRKDFPDSLYYFRQGKNVIILRTFSKIYGLAGLRIGYGIAGNELIRYMDRCRQPFNVNILAQEAARAALDDSDFIKKAQGLVREGKKYLYRELDKLKIDYIPSAANFILIDIGQDGLVIFNKLLRKGVIVRDMRQYGLKNFIRLTVGTEKENEKFIEALKKIL